MSEAVSALRVGDEAFLVSSMIERCPRVMMPRELMKNALEAAEQAPIGSRSVEIKIVMMGGHRKLAIWNTGPGMDADSLYRMCDLASSIGKQKGLGQNFGMGAKVASLPSNERGIRYRSCTGGAVHEVILGKREGVYGRVRRPDPATGDLIEVADVTEATRGEGQDTSVDWTEVVLFGNRNDQDTVADPYDGDPVSAVQWLADYLYHRFYRMPAGVRVDMHEGTHKLKNSGKRQFKTIVQRREEGVFNRYEAVTTPEGIVIHYIYDEPYEKSPSHNRSVGGALQTDVSNCAVVFKDEMYELRKSRAWTQDAPIFGVPFGGRHISIHVELPDNYPVLPEGYRQFLRYQAGSQDRVAVTDFAELVTQHRPEWLKEIIRQLAPDSATTDDIRDELQKLLNELRIRRASPRTSITGLEPVDVGNGAGAHASSRGVNGRSDEPKRQDADITALPTGAKRASIYDNLERAPQIVLLKDIKEVEDKSLKGRAGRYYHEQNQLFINGLYPAVGEMQRMLEIEYASAPDPEAMRTLAVQLAERHMVLRVGRAVVFALAKRLNQEWDREAVDKAMSPESLSLAADDYTGSLQPARRSMGTRLRTTRSDALLEPAV